MFVVITANAQDVIFTDSSSEVKQGEQLNNTPTVVDGTGEGYSQVGTVYKYPSTGELILIENWRWKLKLTSCFTIKTAKYLFILFKFKKRNKVFSKILCFWWFPLF